MRFPGKRAEGSQPIRPKGILIMSRPARLVIFAVIAVVGAASIAFSPSGNADTTSSNADTTSGSTDPPGRWVCGTCWTECDRRQHSTCPGCGKVITSRG